MLEVYLIRSINARIMAKHLQTPVALCAALTSFGGQTSLLLFLALVCGSVFALTFHFHINCLEAESLEIGEEAMTSELLPVVRFPSTELVSTKLYLNDVFLQRICTLCLQYA